jgi:transposase
MVVEHAAAHESQWAAITSIAEKIGCTAETLRKWMRQAERDQGMRPDLTTEGGSGSSSSSGRTSSCGGPMKS